MNPTLSPVSVQKFYALQGELFGLVERDYTGLPPQARTNHPSLRVHGNRVGGLPCRGFAQGRGVGQPEADRCALACAFLAKTVLDLKTTRALDHFESIIATRLEADGFWVRRSFKVNVTKEEKRQTGKHSIPRPEIDLVALNFSKNEVFAFEAKSFLDSPGVSSITYRRSTNFQNEKTNYLPLSVIALSSFHGCF
jgi:hypothetical protein